MQKSLPSLFMIVVSAMAALFGHQWHQQKQMNQQLNLHSQSLIQTIHGQNLQQETANIQLKEEMEQEVREEILNENKRDNQYLPDTLAIIRERTTTLLNQPNVARQDLLKWKEELTDLLASDKPSMEEFLLKEAPFELPAGWQEAAQLHHVILNWEVSAYRYLNWRLGSTRCSLRAVVQQIIPTHHVAIAGEKFVADLQMALESHITHPISSEDSYFASSIGHTQYSPKDQSFQLVIDTNNMLNPDERQRTINFVLTARYPKPTGGYWSYPQQHQLTVVRVAAN
ncbi:MAG: hypothetical protein AAF587_14570 [Bacteroidota bacterium]